MIKNLKKVSTVQKFGVGMFLKKSLMLNKCA